MPGCLLDSERGVLSHLPATPTKGVIVWTDQSPHPFYGHSACWLGRWSLHKIQLDNLVPTRWCSMCTWPRTGMNSLDVLGWGQVALLPPLSDLGGSGRSNRCCCWGCWGPWGGHFRTAREHTGQDGPRPLWSGAHLLRVDSPPRQKPTLSKAEVRIYPSISRSSMPDMSLQSTGPTRDVTLR